MYSDKSMIIHVFLLILFRLAINVCAYFLTAWGSNQLLRMAWLLGFEGGEAEWDKEYVVLCRSYNWILGTRWAPTMDGAPLSGANFATSGFEISLQKIMEQCLAQWMSS